MNTPFLAQRYRGLLVGLLILLALSTITARLAATDAALDQETPSVGEFVSIDLVGQIGGNAGSVNVQGIHVYAGVGPRLVALDVKPYRLACRRENLVLPEGAFDYRSGQPLYPWLRWSCASMRPLL